MVVVDVVGIVVVVVDVVVVLVVGTVVEVVVAEEQLYPAMLPSGIHLVGGYITVTFLQNIQPEEIHRFSTSL